MNCESQIWSRQNALGRMEAEHDLAAVRQTDNMPLLVSKIRSAATDDSPFSVGYLYAIGQQATR